MKIIDSTTKIIKLSKALEFYLNRECFGTNYCESMSGRGFFTSDPVLLNAIARLDVNFEGRGEYWGVTLNGVEKYFTPVEGERLVKVDFYGFEGSENFRADTEDYFGVDLSIFSFYNTDNAINVSIGNYTEEWKYHYEATLRNGKKIWSPNKKDWYAVS
jgi:hypothetical protein